jgi:hypothetical protein
MNAAGDCLTRSAGAMCVDEGQCGSEGCDEGRGRCERLLAADDAATDPALCRSNAIDGTGCLAEAGASASSANECASNNIGGGICLPSEPAERCGADFDCGGGLGCIIERGTCVHRNNSLSNTAATCASGRLVGAMCPAGQRGDTCVADAVGNTCRGGLACLDGVCR